MIEYNIHLNKCQCGHRAELIAEAIARVRYDDVGNRDEIYFIENPWYVVRCKECERETRWLTNMQAVVDDWNTQRYYYEPEDEEDDDEDEDDDWGWVDAIVHQD